MKVFCLLLSFGLSHLTSAQNLTEAIEKYYSDIHISYDPETIQTSKIQTIESVRFIAEADTLSEYKRSDRLEFNQSGKITCE